MRKWLISLALTALWGANSSPAQAQDPAQNASQDPKSSTQTSPSQQPQQLANSDSTDQPAQGAAHLSNVRYKGGVASYLEVLTNETNYFSAELNLAQAQANELLALVQLYQALGGGWQQ